MALLREVARMSKRTSQLISQSFKWKHNADGSKAKQMLAPDSAMPAPLFALCDICDVEDAEEKATQVFLRDHPGRNGCDVAGRAFGVDRVCMNAIQATKTDRTGGMATAGTKEDPHLLGMTGDGAGMSRAQTGVHLSTVLARQ